MQRVIVLLLFLQAAAWVLENKPILDSREKEAKGTWQQKDEDSYLQHSNVGVHFYIPVYRINQPWASPPPLLIDSSPHITASHPTSSSPKSAPLSTGEVVATIEVPSSTGVAMVASLSSVADAEKYSAVAAGVSTAMAELARHQDQQQDSAGNSSTAVEDEEMPGTVHAGINIEDYLKCFDNLPDAGAEFTIKVMVDIPVDANPNSLINMAQTGLSVGHVFVTISKTLGNQTISQTLGFYPANDYKSVSLAPVTSKLADDGAETNGHEYNASITLDGWNAAEFRALLNQIRYNARMRYEIDAFNCANFVGSSLNAVRPNTLSSVSTTGINPLNPTELISIPWSPNGVYKSLVDLKATNPRLASKIEVNVIKYCQPSKGPCS